MIAKYLCEALRIIDVKTIEDIQKWVSPDTFENEKEQEAVFRNIRDGYIEGMKDFPLKAVFGKDWFVLDGIYRSSDKKIFNSIILFSKAYSTTRFLHTNWIRDTKRNRVLLKKNMDISLKKISACSSFHDVVTVMHRMEDGKTDWMPHIR